MKKIIITGATGRMGLEAIRTVLAHTDKYQLLGAIASPQSKYLGQDIGVLANCPACNIKVTNNLEDILKANQIDIVLDLSVPESVYNNAVLALKYNARPILGATGFTEENIQSLKEISTQKNLSVIIAPNFAIGAILMMEVSKKIAQYMPNVEIIEYHHDQKLDNPSGTAVKTAKLLSEVIKSPAKELSDNTEPRGELVDNIRVHSIRMPGMLAHQEVIFGEQGQTLTIRHDTLNRTAFMPGVLLCLDKITNIQGLIYGLENLLD